MKKSILFFAAIAALLSCSKENPATDNLPAETYSVTIEASAPEASDETGTKTTLVDGKLVHWTKGDAIKVLFFPNHTHTASFSGSAGTFKSTFDAETSSQANFRCDSWAWGVEQNVVTARFNDGLALYPSTCVATSSKNTSGTGSAINTELYYDLKSTQYAINGNIESGLNFSYATVCLGDFYNAVNNSTSLPLSFNNACAIIKATMPTSLDKEVTSLTITSADEKPLTGKGNVDLNSYNDGLQDNTFTVIAEGKEGVTLQKNDGSSLKAGETYYAVVWPGTHTSLVLTFNAADGTVATKKTNEVTLTASHIKPYTISSSLEFEAPGADVSSHTYYYADGTTGIDVKDNIVGVIFFHGDPSEVMNDPDLPEAYCNGLAISLNDYKTPWSSSNPTDLPTAAQISNATDTYTTGGYTVKKFYTDAGFNLPIYTNSSYPALPANTSGWYLPVKSEWTMLFGALDKINEYLNSANATKINLGSGGQAKNDGYWLPLWYKNSWGSQYAVSVNAGYYGNAITYDVSKYLYSDRLKTRPIFAF